MVSSACLDPLVILKVGQGSLRFREIEGRVDDVTPDNIKYDVLVVEVFAAAVDGRRNIDVPARAAIDADYICARVTWVIFRPFAGLEGGWN